MIARLLALLILPGVCLGVEGYPLKGRALIGTPLSTGAASLQKVKLLEAAVTATPFPEFSRAQSGFTFTRASVATYKDADDKLQTVAADLPRFGVGEEGILLESIKVNPVEYSEELENVAWSNDDSSSVVHDAVLSPDCSTTSADVKYEVAGDTYQYLYQNYTGDANGVDILSAFFKTGYSRTVAGILIGDTGNGEVYAFYQVDECAALSTSKTGATTAAAVSTSTEQYANGWCRCTLVAKMPAATTRWFAVGSADSDKKLDFAGDAAKGMAITGVDMTVSSSSNFLTSYVKGVAAGGTRYADVLRYSADNLDETAVTIQGTFTIPNGARKSQGFFSTAAFSDGLWALSAAAGKGTRAIGPNADFSTATDDWAAGVERKVAIAYQASVVRLYLDSVQVGEDVLTGALTHSYLQIGPDLAVGGAVYAKDISVYGAFLEAKDLP